MLLLCTLAMNSPFSSLLLLLATKKRTADCGVLFAGGIAHAGHTTRQSSCFDVSNFAKHRPPPVLEDEPKMWPSRITLALAAALAAAAARASCCCRGQSVLLAVSVSKRARARG